MNTRKAHGSRCRRLTRDTKNRPYALLRLCPRYFGDITSPNNILRGQIIRVVEGKCDKV